jgi:hypothetical protein
MREIIAGTAEGNFVFSRVQGKTIELVNGAPVAKEHNRRESLTDFILRSRGFDSIFEASQTHFIVEKEDNGQRTFRKVKNDLQIPQPILRQVLLIDSLQANENEKVKIFAYKLWQEEGKLSSIREYLPEESTNIERLNSITDEVMMDEGRFANLFTELDELEDALNDLLPIDSTRSVIAVNEYIKVIAEKKLNSTAGHLDYESIRVEAEEEIKRWYKKRKNERSKISMRRKRKLKRNSRIFFGS